MRPLEGIVALHDTHQIPQRIADQVVRSADGRSLTSSCISRSRSGRLTCVCWSSKRRRGCDGGNTRWSPSNMRMSAPDRVEPSFVQDMLAATRFKGDEAYFRRLAQDAPGDCRMDLVARKPIHPATRLLGERPAEATAPRPSASYEREPRPRGRCHRAAETRPHSRSQPTSWFRRVHADGCLTMWSCDGPPYETHPTPQPGRPSPQARGRLCGGGARR